LGAAGNFMLSPEQRQVDQAQRNFINATLRRESGASISPSEFENARKQYFVSVNDDPQTIANKRRNRELVLKGMARGAGSGSVDIEDVAKNNPYANLGGQSGVPKTGELVDGHIFLGGNPADPARWRKQ